VSFEGVRLPPGRMRYCGPRFRDDATFLGSGRAEARRLVSELAVGESTSLLEVGCGPGRLPIGMIAEGVRVARYDGVDIDAAAVRWCRRHLSSDHPEMRFHHVEAQHRRYNPDGPAMAHTFRLPVDTGAVDLVYLHSVFANLEPADIRVYLREFRRVLRPSGCVFLTPFVEDAVPPAPSIPLTTSRSAPAS